MTIYQIHEYSGEYEDYRDYIVGSYLNKEKAAAKMEELQCINKEKYHQAVKCLECPISDINIEAEDFCTVVELCSKYCNNAKITEDEFGFDCDNYYNYWEETTYKIKEVEVEE